MDYVRKYNSMTTNKPIFYRKDPQPFNKYFKKYEEVVFYAYPAKILFDVKILCKGIIQKIIKSGSSTLLKILIVEVNVGNLKDKEYLARILLDKKIIRNTDAIMKIAELKNISYDNAKWIISKKNRNLRNNKRNNNENINQ